MEEEEGQICTDPLHIPSSAVLTEATFIKTAIFWYWFAVGGLSCQQTKSALQREHVSKVLIPLPPSSTSWRWKTYLCVLYKNYPFLSRSALKQDSDMLPMNKSGIN